VTLVGPRILYALARDRQLPASLAVVHPRWRTPHVGVIVFAVAVWAIALLGSFAQLAAVSAVARLLFSAATCLALPILRRRSNGSSPRFRVPGGMLVPVAATALSLWLLAGLTAGQALAGAGALLAGILLWVVQRQSRRSA
jgi:amino acid transporter